MKNTISWAQYSTSINNKDRFLTRYYHFLRYRKVLAILDSLFKTHKIAKGLDIGCSYGWYSNILISKGIESVDAIDMNSYEDSVIIDPRITFYHEDFLKKEFDKKYDIILAFEVFEHIPAEERHQFIDKLTRLLNNGGLLVFSGPNSISLLYGFAYIVSFLRNIHQEKRDIDWHYRIPFFYYNRILENENLTILKWETNGFFVLYPHSIEKVLGNKMIQRISGFDALFAPILKGLGANYFCVVKRK
jgi:SAM-dependent methyltransferase